MSQISGQPDGTLPDGNLVADPQVPAGTPLPSVADGQPPNQPGSDGPSVSIPRHTIPAELNGNVYGLFKDYKDTYKPMKAEGWTELVSALRAKGMKPWQIQQALEGGQTPSSQTPPPAAEARPLRGQQEVYDKFGQPVVLDPNDDPVLKHLSESDKKTQALEAAFAKLQQDLTASQRQQAQEQYNAAWHSAKAQADSEIRKAAEELGIKPDPKPGKWLGEDSEAVDFALDAFESQVERCVWKLRTRTGDDSGMPPTKAEIAFVKEALKPYYATQDLNAAGRVADRQKHLPKGAVPRGSGGGASRQPKKDFANDDERREAVLNAARPLLEGRRHS